MVFANYTATADFPGCSVWRELAAAYPEAKVLLTLHPKGPDAWFESAIDTIYFTENAWQFRVLELLTPFGRKFGDMSHKLIWGRTLNGVMGDKAKAVARYDAYVGEVKAAVPPDKLLVFKVTDGWEPLCSFLGVNRAEHEIPKCQRSRRVQETYRRRHQGRLCDSGRDHGRHSRRARRRLLVAEVGRLKRKSGDRPKPSIDRVQVDLAASATRAVAILPRRGSLRTNLAHAAAELASEEITKRHPIGVADQRGNLLDVIAGGPQEMHRAFDAQILEV